MKQPVKVISILLLIQIAVTGNSQDSRDLSSVEPFRGKYTIKNEQFAIWNGRAYIPQFIKGINLGVSVPGTQPGNLAATREDYRRWFHLIREAGYNTIRLYTLHYPRFYEELEHYNLEHPMAPLLVIQGIWLDENEGASDLYEQTHSFSQEISEVVRAIHGDIQIDTRFGKAFGSFSSDISNWVIGFMPGREIFPGEVALTNQNHPEENEYIGSYFHLEGGGDPVEVWLSQRIDSLMIFEYENYQTVRPTGFSSWPTLDPLTHPTEQHVADSQEDDEQIDLSNLVPTSSSGGFFIGFHAYPYYPDFIVQDPVYNADSDALGPNSYLGYLKALKEHYQGIPVIVAEYGVPSSWGTGHFATSGMHHGGLSEEDQGKYAIRMLGNIHEVGFAGGIQFSLIDEWFKQTWITNPLTDSEFRHFWHNITSPEQNFGILAYDSPPEPYTESGSYPGGSISGIRLSSDYAYFRIRLYMDTEVALNDTLWIAFDTYGVDLGESILPDLTSIGSGTDTLRAEFALRVPVGSNRADLFVIPSYDVYGIKGNIRLDTVVSVKSDMGIWNQVRWKTNYFYNFTQYIGKLNISSQDDPYQFLDAVTIFKDSLEIRIPWTLINYPAPTVRRAMHYISSLDEGSIVVEQEDTLSEGIALTVSHDNEIYQTERYSWSPWDYEKIVNDPPIERKKESFHYLKQRLPFYNSPPIGRADTFEVHPGSKLDVPGDSGLLANDFDIDGNQIQTLLSFGNGTSNGSLHVHPNGSFNYIPDQGFQGEDFFMYYIDDGISYSTLVPVHLQVRFPLNETQVHSGSRISIYPNPGRDRFCISIPESFRLASLKIMDLTGREIMFTDLKVNRTWVTLENVKPGVYLFYVEVDQIVTPRRIIVR